MNLKTKHNRAIELMASGKRIVETADSVSVSERTVYNWLDDPIFLGALHKRQGEYIRQLNNKLIDLNDKAMDVLSDGMESRNENIKVRCAAIIIGHYHRTVEFENILARLARLEELS